MYKYIHNHSMFRLKNVFDVKNSSAALYIFFKLNISLKKKKKSFFLKKLLISRFVLIIDLKELVNRKVHSVLTERQIILFFTLFFISLFRKLWTKVEEADIGKPVRNETRSLLPFVDNASVVTSIVYFLNFSQFFFISKFFSHLRSKRYALNPVSIPSRNEIYRHIWNGNLTS